MAKPFGLVGVFESPAKLYHACEKLRDAGYRRFDAHTPFPVHGLEKAMGLPPSRLPWIVLVAGITGGLSAIGLQWWTSVIDYPLVIGGKPFWAYQAYVPITFELTILLSAFGAFFGMWGLNGLPRYFHPVMQHPQFPRCSDDGFLLAVEADDPKYDAGSTRRLLEEAGATNIQELPQ